MIGSLRLHGQTIKLTRESYGEIADVDHLLDFTPSLLHDLSHLQRDEFAQRILLGPERLAQIANDEAALGRRNHAPLLESFRRCLHHLVVVLR